MLQSVFGGGQEESGIIKVDGKQVPIKNTLDAIKNGMGLVPEGRKQQGILSKLSVKSNVSVVNLRYQGKLGFLSKKMEEEKVKRIRSETEHQNTYTGTEDYKAERGNQQKAIIARWLMNNPRILFLDEPTQGIDVGTKTEIYKIIDSLAKMGLSIVMVSSEMVENISLCVTALSSCMKDV